MASPTLPEPHRHFGVKGPVWPVSSPTTEAAEALIIPTQASRRRPYWSISGKAILLLISKQASTSSIQIPTPSKTFQWAW